MSYEKLDAIRDVAAKILGVAVTSVEHVNGSGKNSRVYKLIAIDKQVYVLKQYFIDTNRNMRRMVNDFAATSFLWEHGERSIPCPVTLDNGEGCAVYEFVDGRELDSDSVSLGDVDQAVNFLIRLKNLSRSSKASVIGSASEGGLSIQGVINNIKERLIILYNQPSNRDGYSELKPYLNNIVTPALESICNWSYSLALQSHISIEDNPAASELILSPSDFGFHNALKLDNGKIVFFDFEHFGWDDPAKLISDFLLHPAMNLASTTKQQFLYGMLRNFDNADILKARLKILYPLFGIKWCLIMLNEFTPENFARREFSLGSAIDLDDIRSVQLEKSKNFLNTLMETYVTFGD